MLNLQSVNMFIVFSVIFLSTLSTVICNCVDRDTDTVYSSLNGGPLIYREFPSNYSVRPFCPEGQQVTEISMMPTCNSINVPLYPMPNCAVRYNGILNGTINGTTLTITWNGLIKPSSIHVYSTFNAAGVAVVEYNEAATIGYTGYSINDGKHTHTSYVSLGDINPVNQLTAEFSSKFCGNQNDCEERFDVNNITVWHLPCGVDNQLNINISMGIDFHNGLFAYKNIDSVTQWSFDINSCNPLKCTDVGIDCEPNFSPALDHMQRAKNATIATCSVSKVNATINCINGNWLGHISKPAIGC